MNYLCLWGAGALVAAGLAGCQPTYVLDTYSTMRYDALALPAAADTMRLTAVDFVSAREGFVGGAGGAFFATTDGGQTWARRTAPNASSINKLLFTTATAGWAATDYGLLRTSNGGQTWQGVTLYDYYNGPPGTVQDVQFVTAQIGYAVGGAGSVYKTTNGGSTWTSLVSRRDKAYTLRAVSFTSPDSGMAVGAQLAQWTTTNGGLTWELSDSYGGSGGSTHFDVLRYGRGHYLLAANDGFHDYGAAGYPLEADEDLGRRAYGLAAFGPRGPWVAVGDHLLIRRHEHFSQNAGRTPWAYVHQPDGTSFGSTYYAADFADASTFYAVGAHGVVHRFHYE